MSLSCSSLCLVVVLLVVSSCPLSSSSEEHKFSFKEGTKNGPENWSSIDQEWKACGNGKIQSPIALSQQNATYDTSLGPLKPNYKLAPAVLKNRGHDVMVIGI